MLRAAVKINYYDDAIVVALCALRYFFSSITTQPKVKCEMARKENVFHLTKLCFFLLFSYFYSVWSKSWRAGESEMSMEM